MRKAPKKPDAEFLRNIVLPGDHQGAERLHAIAARLERLDDHPQSDAVSRLLDCADAWQTRRHRRSPYEAMQKVVEECGEFFCAPAGAKQLDELGDVIVSALRGLSELSSAELRFVCEMMEMKVKRRTGDDGVKDPEAEADYRAARARALGIPC